MVSNVLRHKGYVAEIGYDESADAFHGRVIGIRESGRHRNVNRVLSNVFTFQGEAIMISTRNAVNWENCLLKIF
jgi:predicted HicB family RNase H-like nuclease